MDKHDLLTAQIELLTSAVSFMAFSTKNLDPLISFLDRGIEGARVTASTPIRAACTKARELAREVLLTSLRDLRDRTGRTRPRGTDVG